MMDGSDLDGGGVSLEHPGCQCILVWSITSLPLRSAPWSFESKAL